MITNLSLFREIFDACKTAEEEWRQNERRLQMQVDNLEALNSNIIKLLKNPDVSNDEKVTRLKIYYGIN